MLTGLIVTTVLLGTLLILSDDNPERKYYTTIFSLPLVLFGLGAVFNW